MTNKLDPAFITLATTALDNAGIDTAEWIRAARATADVAARVDAITQTDCPWLIKATKDKIVYEIMFDLSDDGIIPDYDDPAELRAPRCGNHGCYYQTKLLPYTILQECESNQPYNAYAPRVQFLQLRDVQVRRSAFMAINEQKLHPGEVTTQQMYTTAATVKIDDRLHVVDKELMTMHKHEIAVWDYLMPQYNLKPSLCKSGKEDTEAAVSELGADTAPRDGHKEGDGSIETEQRSEGKGVIFTIIPQREENWKDQGTGVHKQSATESLHSKEGYGIANCFDQVSVHHFSNCRK